MAYIGIDIGTTGICVTKVAADGEVLETRHAANDAVMHVDQPFARLQDPTRIETIVRSLLQSMLADTDGIGISCQMHGILYVDRSGRAVSPLFTWQDGRGAMKDTDGESFAAKAHAYAGYGYATHLYNTAHGLVPDDAEKLCSIGDYLAMRLCEVPSPLTHITNAASFGAFDLKTGTFDRQDALLPAVTAAFAQVGTFHRIPVYIAVGDNQAGFIGSVSDSDCALVNVGTGSQISVLSDRPSSHESLETRPFDGSRFLLAGCALCGGRAFADVVRFLSDCAVMMTGSKVSDAYRAVDAALAAYDGPSLDVDTRFAGTRSDPARCGAINGIREDRLTPQALLRGTLRGIANELYDMYAQSGVNVKRLVLAGNGVRKNPYLRAAIESVFDLPTRVPVFLEEAAFGAALTAMIGDGVVDLAGAGALIRYE